MQIISRAEWGARAPRSIERVSWAERTEYIQHYSGASADQTVRAIQNFHMDTRGWADIGYNQLVNQHGQIFMGRGWTVVGAHATGHNRSGIGTCYISPGPVTAAGLAAMRWLYDQACAMKGSRLPLRGHRDVGNTSCPGDELYALVRAGLPAGTTTPTPGTPPAPNWTETIVDNLPTLSRGANGRAVAKLQALINVVLRHVGRAQLVEDGDFGGKTEAELRWCQGYFGLVDDGDAGPKSWGALLSW